MRQSILKNSLLLIAITLSSRADHSKEENWIPLKRDTHYPNSAYSLREDVNYFELRKYVFDLKGKKQLSDAYAPYFVLYRKKLSSYPKKLVDQFRRIPFNVDQPTNIRIDQGSYTSYSFKAKGFLIKTDNRFWTINEEKDFLWLFDTIDTEAELHYWLSLNGFFNAPYERESSYHKTSTGYDIKRKEVEYKVSKTNQGEYDEYTSYEHHRTYHYHVTPQGVITKKLYSQAIKNRETSRVVAGFHGDPGLPMPPRPATPLSELLRIEKFIMVP